MGSRIKQNPSKLFDCFLEVARGADEPWILRSFPANFKEKEPERVKSVCSFVYPCHLEISAAVETFSFVLTDLEAQWTFGFCRQAANAETALVFLSCLPWHDAFFRLLNNVAELIASQEDAIKFVEACYKLPRLPDPGSVFHVTWDDRDFTCPVPDTTSLPTIPENRNLTEYFNAVGVETMLKVFAAMLQERRVIVTSRRLSRLSACVQAANSLIYPMFWQHIFIPILPKQLMMYLSAPMPFLIGVPSLIMKHVRLDEIGEVVILDADSNSFSSPFDDVLPQEVVGVFKRSMKNHRDLLGDVVARVFLQAVVHLIGGYREALRMRDGHKITFDEEAFLTSRSQSLRPFLRNMQQLQIFRQFVDDRLNLLNEGKGFSDEFEKEAVWFTGKTVNAGSGSRIKSQAAALTKEVRKEGGALVKAVKSKANPAIKNAIKSGRASSRNAYKGMKSFVKEAAGSNYNLKAVSGTGIGTESGPERETTYSEPSSPNLSFRSDIGHQDSTGSSNNDSITSNHHQRLWRTNTDLNFAAPKVLKYERFDPPPVSSPEFENPPLNLDLMNDMKEVLGRKTSPLKSAVYLVPVPDPEPKPEEADLINFGGIQENGNLSQGQELEVINFDPLSPVAPKRSNKDLPRPPSHRPLGRSTATVPSRSSENLLQEYGLDFGKMSLTNNPDPFADLDPLSGSKRSQPPQPPPRIKKMSLQQPPQRAQSGWTTFD